MNKGISGIQYNVLNLPTGVTFASGGFIQHGYTADGIKRRMMYKEADGSGNPVPTVYCCNAPFAPADHKRRLAGTTERERRNVRKNFAGCNAKIVHNAELFAISWIRAMAILILR